VAKVTLHFAGGATEEMVLKNGVEFALHRRFDVPGSKEAPELTPTRPTPLVSKEVKGRKCYREHFLGELQQFGCARVSASPRTGGSPVPIATPLPALQRTPPSSSGLEGRRACRQGGGERAIWSIFAAEGSEKGRSGCLRAKR